MVEFSTIPWLTEYTLLVYIIDSIPFFAAYFQLQSSVSIFFQCDCFDFYYLGALNNDVTYIDFYDYLNCLLISPCAGWMVKEGEGWTWKQINK